MARVSVTEGLLYNFAALIRLPLGGGRWRVATDEVFYIIHDLVSLPLVGVRCRVATDEVGKRIRS